VRPVSELDDEWLAFRESLFTVGGSRLQVDSDASAPRPPLAGDEGGDGGGNGAADSGGLDPTDTRAGR
jgi:hypothetical protein